MKLNLQYWMASRSLVLACIVLFMSPLTVFGGSLTDYSWSLERTWANALEGSKRDQLRVQRALDSSDRGRALEALQALSLRPAFSDSRAQAEHWLFVYVLPGWADRFERTAQVSAYTVRQDDDLIDGERAPWATVTYPNRVKAKTTEQLATPVLLTDPATPMRNAARMRIGQAPYGPDNGPVQVCALLMGSDRYFYEMREVEAQIALAAVRHPEPELTCLGPDDAVAYWKMRYHDFVNQRGEFRARMSSDR